MNFRTDAQILCWKDIRQEVQLVNLELANIIDDLDPSVNYPLILANYPYGASIYTRGKFSISSDSPKNIFSLNTANELFDYHLFPLALVLTKSCEIFLKMKTEIVPINYLLPGDFFGCWELISSSITNFKKPIWNVTAGARSLFFLPTLSNLSSYNKLTDKKISPTNLMNQWYLLNDIILQYKSENQWFCKILYFTKPWFSKLNDHKWLKFENYLLRESWRQNNYLRNENYYCFIWQILLEIIEKYKLESTPYQIDTIKHLLAIQTGAFPGFRPADNSCLSAPINLFQKIFVEQHQLNNYLPIMMHPFILRKQNPQSLYYSLSLPTLTEGRSYINQQHVLKELKAIRYLLSVLCTEINEKNNPFAGNIDIKNFNFYYVHADENILPFSQLPAYDPAFLILKEQYPNQSFPEANTFARGCIQISI